MRSGLVDTIDAEPGMQNFKNQRKTTDLPRFKRRWETLESGWTASYPLRALTVAVGKKCRGDVLNSTTIECLDFMAEESLLITLPKNLSALNTISLSGSKEFTTLPPGLIVDVLHLRECTALSYLPEDMEVFSLDVSGCTNLGAWPERLAFKGGRLGMANCTKLNYLPAWLKKVHELDISGCPGITELPEDLEITGTIHLAGSGIKSLPAGCNAQIRWRGVLANTMIAFHPEQLTAAMVLSEPNAERRRVILELVGLERFMKEANAEILHSDTDPGGPRNLLRVPMEGDEDIVCLNVLCPSTGNRYVLRVPPTINTCHAAAAWIAGFDNAADYAPLKET